MQGGGTKNLRRAIFQQYANLVKKYQACVEDVVTTFLGDLGA
jgi:hypothetical protein